MRNDSGTQINRGGQAAGAWQQVRDGLGAESGVEQRSNLMHAQDRGGRVSAVPVDIAVRIEQLMLLVVAQCTPRCSGPFRQFTDQHEFTPSEFWLDLDPDVNAYLLPMIPSAPNSAGSSLPPAPSMSSDTVSQLLAQVDVVDIGSGPVVAVAHGAGGGVRENFAPLSEATPGEARFVGPYYPGSGDTPPATDPLDVTTLADQVVAAGIQRGAHRFPIVGLSLGAAVAVTAAVRHPEHVSALVLTVGVARPDPQLTTFTGVWQTLAAAGEWNALAELLVYASGTAESLSRMTEQDVADAVTATLAAYPRGGAAHAELASRADVTPLLSDVAVPTLVIVGGQDRIVLPDTARSLAAIPGSTLIEYPDAGHIFGTPHTGQWATDVHDFLRQPR